MSVSRTRRLRRGVARSAGVLALIACVSTSGALAQNFPQPLFQAPFSFPNPGARSLGFGGAFLALADDATASIANPAGLVQLLEPEVSFDLRLWSYSTPFTAGGRINGMPTGIGLDDTASLEFGVSEDRLAGLSFLSYVYPRKRWSLAFHRHLQGNFQSSTETQGLFGEGSAGLVRISDQRTSSDFELVTYGVSAAYKLTEALSLGVGLTYFDGSLVLESTSYFPSDGSPEGFFEPNTFSSDRVMISQTLSIDDSDWRVNAGILWKLSPSWSLGAVYRAAPTFRFTGFGIAGPANTLGFPPGQLLPFQFDTALTLPDGYGVGFAFRSLSGRTTISFEWDQIEYTDVVDSLELDDQEIDDANELRLGGEYVFLDSTPVIAVRLGAWFDPDHLMRGNGQDLVVDALVVEGEDQMHFSAGFGLAFETFQIDVGIDLSQTADTLSVSAVFTL